MANNSGYLEDPSVVTMASRLGVDDDNDEENEFVPEVNDSRLTVETGILPDNNDSRFVSRVHHSYDVERRLPWYKRPRILYSLAAISLLASLSFATFAILLGIGAIESSSLPQGAAFSKGGAGTPLETFAPTSNPITTTLPTWSPTVSPTFAPTAAPTFAPTALPSFQPTAFERTDPLAFYVMGDVPYNENDVDILTQQIANMTLTLRPGATFLVHVGDLMKGDRTLCQETYFLLLKEILTQGPLPTFVLQGDNDYLSCPDPEQAWLYYANAFVNFEQTWSTRLPTGVRALNVKRWMEPGDVAANSGMTLTRPDLFAFVDDGILFLSLRLINMPDEDESPDTYFYQRLSHTRLWVDQQLQEKRASGQYIRGTVMFGHALLSTELQSFFRELKNVFYQHNIYSPVLYVHGDGHVFNVNSDVGANLLDWSGFIDVQVDEGALADPLLIEVAPLKNGIAMSPLKAETDMQIVVGSGLFRIDRQNGLYNQTTNNVTTTGD